MGRSDRYGSLYLQHPTSNYESISDVENSADSPMVRLGQVLLQKSGESREY